MLYELCKMLGETQEPNLLKQSYLGSAGGDLPKVGQGSEHPAPPGMQRWALCVCQHLSSKGTRRQQCGDSWESRETGMPAMQEGWKSKCKPGNERKGLQRIREKGRENEKGVEELYPSLQGLPGSFSAGKRKKLRDDEGRKGSPGMCDEEQGRCREAAAETLLFSQHFPSAPHPLRSACEAQGSSALQKQKKEKGAAPASRALP